MFKKLKDIYLDLYFLFFPATRLRKSGARIGKNIFFGKYTYFELENAKYIEISDDCVISAFCKFIPHDSSLNNVLGRPVLYGKIILEKNCYVGANTTLLAGTRVGKNTIVGANSLVKGNLKPNSVYVGSPVKYLCSIYELDKKWERRKDKKFIYKKQKRWHEN